MERKENWYDRLTGDFGYANFQMKNFVSTEEKETEENTNFSDTFYGRRRQQQNINMPEIVALRMNEQRTQVMAGETVPLMAFADKTVVNLYLDWESSNETVAIVADNGVVTATAAGETTITATTKNGAVSVSCEVTVTSPALNVYYTTYVEETGWNDWVNDGKNSGIEGRQNRLDVLFAREDMKASFVEAMRIKLGPAIYDGTISYRCFVKGAGWLPEVSDGSIAGVTGHGRKLEAIQINLSGELATYYDIYYRVKVQFIGWMGWAKTGELAGTVGYDYRLEGIEVRIFPKEAAKPVSTEAAFRQTFLLLRSHLMGWGWQRYVSEGEICGDEGRGRGIDAIEISLLNQPYEGEIVFRSYLENAGWEEDWNTSGEISGSVDENRRLEAIELRLVGEMAKHYELHYRTYIEKIGWLGWAKNAMPAGSEGYSYKMEALQVELVPKGTPVPSGDKLAFYKKW